MVDSKELEEARMELNANNNRQHAYRAVFKSRESDELNRAGHDVLADLSARCMMDVKTFSNDPLEMAKRAALKDFFLETVEILNLDYGQLYQIDYTYDKE